MRAQGIGDTTDIIAMILLPVAVLMCGYALVVFLWRGSQIARKQVKTGFATGCRDPTATVDVHLCTSWLRVAGYVACW